MEPFAIIAYVGCISVLVLPNFIDVPINVAMVSTAFFGIVVGSYRSLEVTLEAQRTGESKVSRHHPQRPAMVARPVHDARDCARRSSASRRRTPCTSP
jgi:predicted signal transduction protein with EAL and GGDEF domain